MRATLLITKCKVRESILGPIGQNTKGSGKTHFKTARVLKSGPMELSTQALTSKVKSLEKEFSNGQSTTTPTKETFSTTTSMGSALSPGATAGCMKEIGSKTK